MVRVSVKLGVCVSSLPAALKVVSHTCEEMGREWLIVSKITSNTA